MSNFFEELKKRNVYKVGTAYVVTSWLLMQVIGTLANNLRLPANIAEISTLILIVGFPIALLFTWLYEFTPQGLKLTGKIQKDTTDNQRASRRLNRVIIGTLALVICVMIVERVFSGNTAINEKQKASIAVLPFDNLSADKAYSFFANALPASIIDELSFISGLQVTNRVSSFAVKEAIENKKEMGEVLGVNYLLDGEFEYFSRFNRVRITAYLVNANNGFIVDSYNYEDSFDNIQDIQENISKKISSKLRVQLAPQEEEALAKKITEDTQAYKLYLEAKELTMKRTETDLKKAIELLDEALNMEPQFAEAHAQLSATYSLRSSYGNINKEEANKMMKYHLDRAIEIAPEKPEVIDQKVNYNIRVLNDTTNAISDLKKAIAIKPGYAEAHYTLYIAYLRAKKYEQAFESLKHILRLDPGNGFYTAMLARHVAVFYDDLEKALSIIDTQLLINPNGPNANRAALFKALFLMGEPYGDLVESFKILHKEYKKNSTEKWNLSYNLFASLNLDLWPWAEKMSRTIQLKYPEDRYSYDNLIWLYGLRQDHSALFEITNHMIEKQLLDKEEAAFQLSWIELIEGNTKEAIRLFEEGYPNVANEEILSEEITFETQDVIRNYIELLRFDGQNQKADRFSEKLGTYFSKRLSEPNITRENKTNITLEAYYVSNQKTKFIEELDKIFFEKMDREGWFTNLKVHDYFLFEKDPEYQKLYRKIETETHRMRAEVIEYLKEEGDWNEAWDKELGLQ